MDNKTVSYVHNKNSTFNRVLYYLFRVVLYLLFLTEPCSVSYRISFQIYITFHCILDVYSQRIHIFHIRYTA